jgi:DUF971 family protein
LKKFRGPRAEGAIVVNWEHGAASALKLARFHPTGAGVFEAAQAAIQCVSGAFSMPTPTEFNLHRTSRVLEISFDDGSHFSLPVELLRVYSPSAEVQGHGPGQRVLQLGKEEVNIEQIEPVGNYAVCLHFDDEHNTGIYSWEYLYNLGKNQEGLWKDYLNELEKAGQKRKTLPS